MKDETNWQPSDFYRHTDHKYFYVHNKESDYLGIYPRYDIFGSSPKIEIKKYLFTPVPMVEVPKKEFEYWLYENNELKRIVFIRDEANEWNKNGFSRQFSEKLRKER